MPTTLNLAGLLADDTIALEGIPSRTHPAGGTYTLPSLSADEGLLLTKITRLGETEPPVRERETVKQKQARLAHATELSEALTAFCRDGRGRAITIEQKVLGPALDEMRADGVSLVRIGQVVKLAIVAARDGVAAAEQILASAPAPPAKKPAVKRSPAKKTAAAKAGS